MNKIIFDFLPLILFFVALKLGDIYIATKVAMAATVLQIIWLKVKRQRIEASHWLNLIVIVLFGGLTIYLQDENFIKWKPTVLYWIFALIIAGALLISNNNLIKRLMGTQITLPEPVWTKLAYSWSAFFALMGILNLFVAFSGYFTIDQWATFKVFGLTILLIVFVIGQSLVLAKYMRDEEQ
ncbi:MULTISPECIES: septation protein A [Oligella]|uniref:Inner membrane-spanning protein YciB n=2 Tax=Oligella urethralis TaxID=90245 RepID=A0A095ZCM9_9BURK|nr:MULTISPECIES: septation protein A [Oligella]AVL71061.1 septation protein A [Oligella urethralis]KGF32408.1 septation protein A [Oligella urethralis DNF00040]MDK6203255.1 septation protein A [Oligella urethralis]OFS84720.1 septation protein A [Oligella sp. HMSC05A10]OFV47839.1 septation protein A [Oligella sp. HMSC09E12]